MSDKGIFGEPGVVPPPGDSLDGVTAPKRNPHNHMSALVGDNGVTFVFVNGDKQWRCNYCGMQGSYEALISRDCGYEYPPCDHCGQTPECARDCPGMMSALGGDRVHLAGMIGGEHES